MMKGIVKLVAAVVLFAGLTSCIDIETDIQINDEEDGSITLNYSVSKLIMELGQLDEDDPFSPLPVSESDFIASAAMVPGMEVESVSVDEDEKAVYITSECSFSSVEALSAFFSPDRENDPSLTQEGGETVFRYTLYSAAEEISADSMRMIESFFADDGIVIRLEAPSDITSVSAGSIDNNTAEFTTTILEVFRTNEDIVWEVRW